MASRLSPSLLHSEFEDVVLQIQFCCIRIFMLDVWKIFFPTVLALMAHKLPTGLHNDTQILTSGVKPFNQFLCLAADPSFCYQILNCSQTICHLPALVFFKNHQKTIEQTFLKCMPNMILACAWNVPQGEARGSDLEQVIVFSLTQIFASGICRLTDLNCLSSWSCTCILCGALHVSRSQIWDELVELNSAMWSFSSEKWSCDDAEVAMVTGLNWWKTIEWLAFIGAAQEPGWQSRSVILHKHTVMFHHGLSLVLKMRRCINNSCTSFWSAMSACLHKKNALRQMLQPGLTFVT